MGLHQELLKLRQKENQITSDIINKLQQMEKCRVYLNMGYCSLFDYLVRGLKYSEATAYQRQSCVRLARELPEIKQKIADGALTYSAVTTAYKHIRRKPLHVKRQTLKELENKTSRQVKAHFKEKTKPISIKKTVYKDKVHIRLELTLDQNKKLEKLKALKSHRHDLESLFAELIEKELKTFENTKFKSTKSKNPRQISKRLRNHVLKKSNYRCQFTGCTSQHFLQIDHVVPVRKGGDQRPENLQALCAGHNKLKN